MTVRFSTVLSALKYTPSISIPGLLFLIASTLAHADGTLSGTVVDAADGITPVYPVIVDLIDPVTGVDPEGLFAVTNPDGSYSITDIPPGDWKVIFNAVDVANIYIDELYNNIPCDEGTCGMDVLGDIIVITDAIYPLDVDLVNSLAPGDTCRPDNIYLSSFENELPLLFEDTFEGCRSPLWFESNGDWQIADGAYYTTVLSPSNILPLQPNNFDVELEMSNIRGGGLWLRLSEGSGVILQIGTSGGSDVLFWQVLDESGLGLPINFSANGTITPDTGSHTIRVVVEGDTYQAYVDGKLATTLTHADIIAAGGVPPTRGVVGLFGEATSTRFDRMRIWGENLSTGQIEFTTDQSILLEDIGQTYQFGAHVVTNDGVEIPGIELVWSLEPNALVSLTASSNNLATVEAVSLGVDTLTLTVSAPSLQISAEAQISLADLAAGANYLDSNVVLDNGGGVGNVILVRNAETELIQVGDILISGDGGGLLVRVLSIVDITADQVILEVEPASITDAFENLDVQSKSQPQTTLVHFDAKTNMVNVKSNFETGEVLSRSFSIDGLDCKNEVQAVFDLSLEDGSIDWVIDNQLGGTLKIVNSEVQEFSFSATQTLVLEAKTGALVFSTQLTGKVTCELPLPRLETPAIPISIFSLGMGLQPKLGVEVSGSISGPSFRIEGPSGKVTDTATEGIKYTPGGGWEPIVSTAREVQSQLFKAGFTTEIQFALDARAYGGLGYTIIASLGRGFLSYELAEVEYIAIDSDIKLHAEFSSPFDPMVNEYTGPKWYVEANATGVYKAELTGGGLATLLTRLDIPTSLPFTANVFEPVKIDIAHSPRIGSLDINCTPANCFLDRDNSDHANIIVSTDGDHTGLVEYLASVDGNSNLVKLTETELFHGNSLGVWFPDESDQAGSYRTHLRAKTGLFSLDFPYVLDANGSPEMVVGPNHKLTVEKFNNATGTLTTAGKVVSAPAGIDCGETCEVHFAAGAEVTLTAVSSGASTFVKWADDSEVCAGSALEDCQFSLDSDKTAKVVFEALDCYTSSFSSNFWAVECSNADYSENIYIENFAQLSVTDMSSAEAATRIGRWNLDVIGTLTSMPGLVVINDSFTHTAGKTREQLVATNTGSMAIFSEAYGNVAKHLDTLFITSTQMATRSPTDLYNYTETFTECRFFAADGEWSDGQTNVAVYEDGVQVSLIATPLTDEGTCATQATVDGINGLQLGNSLIYQCIQMPIPMYGTDCPLTPSP